MPAHHHHHHHHHDSHEEQAGLAMRILVHPHVSLSDSALGPIQSITMRAMRHYHGGDAEISAELMRGILRLAVSYRFHITEIAGGPHSNRPSHYAGLAMDIDSINGRDVSPRNRFVKGFMQMARKLGAVEVFGPGYAGFNGHVHVAWPRKRDHHHHHHWP